MTVNVENISRVQEAILAAPEKFNMNHWCGTAMCIGGWCNFLEGKGTVGADGDMIDEHERAAAFLGMDFLEASDLFFPNVLVGWDEITPRQAVDHLEHIKNGGKVNWVKFAPELDGKNWGLTGLRD